jgi:hypothetical protein
MLRYCLVLKTAQCALLRAEIDVKVSHRQVGTRQKISASAIFFEFRRSMAEIWTIWAALTIFANYYYYL